MCPATLGIPFGHPLPPVELHSSPGTVKTPWMPTLSLHPAPPSGGEIEMGGGRIWERGRCRGRGGEFLEWRGTGVGEGRVFHVKRGEGVWKKSRRALRAMGRVLRRGEFWYGGAAGGLVWLIGWDAG